MVALGQRLSWIAVLLLPIAAVAFVLLQPKPVEAACWPNYYLNDASDETTIPTNGGYAKIKASLRGFHYYVPNWVDEWCVHSEAESRTEYTIDYVYWGGEFYFGTQSGPDEYLDFGLGDCHDCNGGKWSSGAEWMGGGLGVWAWAYGYHYFQDGGWFWNPTPPPLETAYPLVGGD